MTTFADPSSVPSKSFGIILNADTNLTARWETGRCDLFRNDARNYQGLATSPPVTADRHHGTQFKSGHGGNDIEPGLAFDADRLKGE